MTIQTKIAADPTFETECFLVGSLFMDARRIDVIADMIAPQDFSSPILGAAFDWIVAEHARGGVVSPVAMRPTIEQHPHYEEMGGWGFLAAISTTTSLVSRPKDAAKIIAAAARKRRISEGLRGAIESGAEGASIEEMIDTADAAIVEATETKRTSQEVSGVGCMDRLMKRMEEDQTGVSCRIIQPLDDLVGTMRRKQFILMAGRPGMGKTAVALSYALGAAQNGHGVLFVSLEMSAEELAARAAADLSFDGPERVPYQAINDGCKTEPVYRAIMSARERMADMSLTIIDAGSLTIGRLNMLVRRIKRRMAAKGERLDLVVVDYLQLLRVDGQRRSNYETVSEISVSLKALAKDNDIAVLALAQLSREVEKRPDKRPQQSDLRDSGQLEQDADTIIFLLREEYYLRKEKPEGWEAALEAVRGKIEFICAKRRNGPEGTAEGTFYTKYQAVRG